MASVASDLNIHLPSSGAEPAAPAEQAAAKISEDKRGWSDLIHRLISRPASDLPQGLPLLRGLSFRRQVLVLGTLVLLSLALTVATFGYVIWEGRINRAQTAVSTEMQMWSQRMAILAEQAARGNPDAFGHLRHGTATFSRGLTVLQAGGEVHGTTVPAASAEAIPLIAEVSARWNPIHEDIKLILSQQQGLVTLKESEEFIRKAGAKLKSLSQQLGVIAMERGEDPRSVVRARQLYYDVTNFDLLDANSQISTDDPQPQVALNLVRNIKAFEEIIQGLAEGNAELGIVALKDPLSQKTAKPLYELTKEFHGHIASVVNNMDKLAGAKEAYRRVSARSEALLSSLGKLTEAYKQQGTGYGATGSGLLFALLTLTFLGLLAKVHLDDARRRAVENERANSRNEQAILRLLDDMSQLAEGDLTRHARVTEDMSGAIADAVNYAIDELRGLVNQINQAANQLTESTRQGRAVSSQLLQVAEKQAKEIQATTNSVLQMASSMDSVSANAQQCAQVAEQSLAASEKGAQAVHESIASMDALREQIQETSKRIKRLGESSQEIGEIVQLIAGITEQTNVLALNAAIQAAAAGEAGRGFTVVAEEVQRLAERSAEATKQIGAIVRTIQSDTHDAVVAMEKSTMGVVEGAKLTDAAGQALQEINEVSKRLADLVAQITRATEDQLQAAQGVAKNMREILHITQQTTKGTKWTAESMGQIYELAQKLKVSVSGFKV
jgi:twitching motility protein PilJ